MSAVLSALAGVVITSARGHASLRVACGRFACRSVGRVSRGLARRCCAGQSCRSGWSGAGAHLLAARHGSHQGRRRLGGPRSCSAASGAAVVSRRCRRLCRRLLVSGCGHGAHLVAQLHRCCGCHLSRCHVRALGSRLARGSVGVASSCGLTPPSSGHPTAGRATAPCHCCFRAASYWLPLMSNVRQHERSDASHVTLGRCCGRGRLVGLRSLQDHATVVVSVGCSRRGGLVLERASDGRR